MRAGLQREQGGHPGADPRPAARHPRRRQGFTLVELMIALAVAGILLSVALPAWRGAVLKSNRAAGRGVLLEVLSRQEQFFINHKRYAITLGDLGLPAPAFYIDSQGEPVSAQRAVYLIELDILSSTFRGVTATARNGQAGDSACLALSLSRAGVRRASGDPAQGASRCW